MADEVTHDALLRGRLSLWQPARGARVTMDPLLLAHFAWATRPRDRLGRVLDLGAGTGVVGLTLALADPGAEVAAVELRPTLAGLARENTAPLGARVRVVEGDLRARDLPLGDAPFDTIVSNPPYQAEGRGRPAAGEDRAAARGEGEASCTLPEVVEAARRRLADRGRLVLVLPAGRLGEAIVALAAARLELHVLRAVHSVADEAARRVLIAAGRGRSGDTQVLPGLVIHGADRRAYTPEAQAILDGDWLPATS